MLRASTLILLLTTHFSFSQIAAYSFAGLTGTTTSVAPTTTNPDVTATDITRSPGIVAVSAAGGFNSSNWPTANSLAADKYLTFTINPATTNNLVITGISFSGFRSPTGPVTLEVITQNGSSSPISRGTQTINAITTNFSFSFTEKTNGAPYTVRIYAYSATGTSGTFRLTENLTLNGAVPLPVTLVSFTGQAQGQNAALEWEVVEATAFSHFSVERGSNVTDFESVGKVSGINTPLQVTYQFLDTNPPRGHNYYRLKAFNTDGSWQQSAIIAVRVEAISSNIYPNPTTDKLFVNYFEQSFSEEFRILNGAGTVITEGHYEGGISTKNLPAGKYFLQLKTADNVYQTHIFCKQ